MRKVIAAINMTLDGYCDHTAMIADDELHDHYAELIRNAGVLLYGRTTYQLMEDYWPAVAKNPTGNKSTDDFALAMEHVPKMLFSHTLTSVGWNNVRLVKGDLEEEVSALKNQDGKDILVGSRSLIVALMKLNLIDEYQLCIHPVVAGSGLPLFEGIADRSIFKLLKTKTFGTGVIAQYYEPRQE
jgi:dihydrofolate reductase